MSEIWVVDTSSILEVRRRIPGPSLRGVYSKLTNLVENDQLVFPIQVFRELEYYYKNSPQGSDLPYEWAMTNKKRATRYKTDYQILRNILQHPQVGNVVDHNKVGGAEEADPYVLSLAFQLKDEYEVTVLAEEIRDRSDKISINTACGLLRLVPLRMGAFLNQRGIWP